LTITPPPPPPPPPPPVSRDRIPKLYGVLFKENGPTIDPTHPRAVTAITVVAAKRMATTKVTGDLR
jgi:hypothetical protein